MKCMGRGIAMSVAGLAFAALILAANKGVADEPIVVLARDKAFCARLARETDRLEFIAPILKMPKIERYFDTRKHEYQDYYIDTNRLYFIDRTLANPKADLDRILKQKDWRKRLFNPGSPVPPTNRRLGYKLVYDESGKWRALDRPLAEIMRMLRSCKDKLGSDLPPPPRRPLGPRPPGPQPQPAPQPQPGPEPSPQPGPVPGPKPDPGPKPTPKPTPKRTAGSARSFGSIAGKNGENANGTRLWMPPSRRRGE